MKQIKNTNNKKETIVMYHKTKIFSTEPIHIANKKPEKTKKIKDIPHVLNNLSIILSII